MRILYLSLVIEEFLGVNKKIKAQKKSLEKITRNKVKECKYEKGYIFFNHMKILKYSSGKTIFQKILRKIQEYILLRKLQNKNLYKEIDCIYIRRFNATKWLLNYLEFLKKLNKKIILEVPTYPYDNEISKENYFTRQDKIWREEYYKYVDKIVTYSEDENIWNIPCINIDNGIDLEENLMIKKEKHKSINFISVANYSFWHGIDRFLYSLLKYKKNKPKEEIKFYIVGEGKEINNLKEIVANNLELKESVIFCGIKMGIELEKIYNNSDIALGSLGIHKLNLKKVQPLKNREYCAKGLPFVIGFNDPSFEDKEYVYKVSYDDELIDIEKLIGWYKNLNISAEKIRKDAENFTWDIQMKKVLENI